MKIKRILSLSILPLLFAANNAHAVFFSFISGSTTGDAGENCVAQNTKGGDSIRLPNGSVATVKTLIGTSSNCSRPGFPMQATLMPSNARSAPDFDRYKPAAGIDLPNGWQTVAVSDLLKSRGVLFNAWNSANGTTLSFSAGKREEFGEMHDFVNSRRNDQSNSLINPQAGAIETLQVNGLPAWRFEARGIGKSSGRDTTYLLTIIDAGNEIVTLNTWIQATSFAEHKAEMGALAYNISGLGGPPAAPAIVPSPAVAPVAAPVSSATPNQARKSVPERLNELNQLHKSGLITDAEFAAKKKEILQDL